MVLYSHIFDFVNTVFEILRKKIWNANLRLPVIPPLRAGIPETVKQTGNPERNGTGPRYPHERVRCLTGRGERV